MDRFKNLILKTYKIQGSTWLQNLEEIVNFYANRWHLENLQVFADLSYNYVLYGNQNGLPIVLKLSPDPKELIKERIALNTFSGFGAIGLLDYSSDALLLKQAIPATKLKELSNYKNKSSLEIACELMQQLHKAPLLSDKLPHIREWLAILNNDWPLDSKLLKEARLWRDELIKLETQEVVLHGDLHRGNILLHQNRWVAIDPKGVIGFPINEIWTFIEEFQELDFVANYFGFAKENVYKWYFIHLVLASIWNIEDSLDPNPFFSLAQKMYSKITL
ncbi:MAG: hypothetical protein BGO10_09885 [Chlamydia sp. 32-24]|nr:MAG: hypothetical protein BGO10_09885 [Chlamydia sp. 32-24]